MSHDEVDLGAMLRGLRRAADLSQRQLATRAGVSQSLLARLESGAVTNPRFRTVERLVRAAGGRLSPAGAGVVPIPATGTIRPTSTGARWCVPRTGTAPGGPTSTPSRAGYRKADGLA